MEKLVLKSRRIITKSYGRAMVVACSLALAFTFSVPRAFAQEETELARANRAIANPLTNNTLFITEFDTARYSGDAVNGDKWGTVAIVEPLIPIGLGDSGWTLITRPIVPLAFSLDVPQGDGTTTSRTGIGDIAVFGLFTKGMNEKGFQWGVGPILQMPTATNNDLGSEKWSAGPAAIMVYNTSLRRDRDLTVGLLNQNFFSFAGDSDRKSVDRSTLQYFATWSITDNWGLLSAPTITWDRNADGGEWTIPVSLGVSYTTKLGDIPTRFVLEPQYFIEQNDNYGADWNIRFAIAMFLPKGGK